MALNKVTELAVVGVPDWHGTTISDFNDWVTKVTNGNRKSIFRGQRQYWPLLPRVIDGCQRGQILDKEGWLFGKFKKDAARCLHVAPDNDWDWLVVAQHHRLSTRLLDWSFDPLVALWFALEKYEEEGGSPEVWVLTPSIDDYVTPEKGLRPFQGTRTKVFKPIFQIPRVVAQKGCFTLFKHVEKYSSAFVPLEKNFELRKKIQRIRISERSCKIILQELERNGYNHEYIYPDIDEVSKRIMNEWHEIVKYVGAI